MFYTKSLTQFSYASSDSVHCDNAIIALVSLLFSVCCPPAIIWTVIAVFVWISIKRLSGRSFPHVLKKVFKGSPPLAYFYSLSPIALVVWLIGICAPSPHCAPNCVSIGFGASVNCVPLSRNITHQTSARFRFPISKIFIFDDHRIAALTNAHASGSFIQGRGVGDYGESGECCSNKRYFRHDESLSLCLAATERRQPFGRCDYRCANTSLQD